MSWWMDRGRAATQTIAGPAPDREAECHARVREVKAELDRIDGTILSFKSTNRIKTDKFGRLLGCESATLNGREKIETEWRALLNRRDKIVERWHESLHQWAAVKEETKCQAR
jgi:hypothetical protein